MVSQTHWLLFFAIWFTDLEIAETIEIKAATCNIVIVFMPLCKSNM